MLSKFKFLKTAPAEYKNLWTALSTGLVHPSHYGTFQLFLGGKKIDQSIVTYNHENRDEYASTVGNELFLLRIDLRNGWTGLHFHPDWISINLWLNGNASQIAEHEYISFLITEHSIFTLHFNMGQGEVTVNAFVRDLNEPVQHQAAEGILLNCKEATLVRYALSQMYYSLTDQDTKLAVERKEAICSLDARLKAELESRHNEKIAYISSIGQEVQQ